MKKRIMAIMSLVIMATATTACGSDKSKETTTELTATEDTTTGQTTQAENGETGMVDPWIFVASSTDAAEGAGVGYFMVPEDGMSLDGGEVHMYGFKYMEGIAEADGSVGAAEITIRKGLKQDTEDVSGDYNEYSFEWTVETEDWEVKCYGNEEGKTMKAIWLSDNFSYSIAIRGQGDLYDTYGLGDDDIKKLVTAIQ
ncbi:MAG: hypothetical protein J6P57_06140 [Lachnospiraceae bacterium]|nr:hypothetical protein [Lachnospiraceae bacterium]